MRLELETETRAPFTETTDNVESSNMFDSVLAKGIASARSGDRENARTLLTRASELDPTSVDAWMWLASISEYPEELLAFLNRVLDNDPENVRALEWRLATTALLANTLVQRAVTSHDEGNDELARQCLDNAVGLDTCCEMAWFWKAWLADSEEQKTTYLERVLEINPNNADAQAALASLAQARFDVMMTEARAAAVSGDFSGSLELLDEVLMNKPENVEAWLLRSHLSTNFEDKIDSLEKALTVDPDHVMAISSHSFLTELVRSVAVNATSEAANPEAPKTTEHYVEAPQAETIVESSVSAHWAADGGSEVTTPYDAGVNEPFHVTEEPFAEPVLETVSKDTHELVTAEFDVPVITDDPQITESVYDVQFDSERRECPFCSAPNEEQAFECGSCHAMLTLADMETLLGNARVDRDKLTQAVTRMEADWNLRDFHAEELTALGIGHLNLGNFQAGRNYLEEASRLDPNNVILSGQVRAVAIRLEELSGQNRDTGQTGKTILVVDDSPTVRKLISGKLEKSGHIVVCAEDGIEALARMEESLPDLVLLDITMPRMDGYEVCKHIRANPAAKDLPVVMISGKDGFFDKVRGRMAGTTGYVTKPFGPETLMKALETYLLPETVSVD